MYKRKYDKINKEKFLELYESGKPLSEIATELNTSLVNVKDHYYGTYFAFERIGIEKIRHNNIRK